MKVEYGTGRFLRAACAPALLWAGWHVFGLGLLNPDPASAQGASPRPAADYQVVFEFTQSDKDLGGSTVDQITVIFSNQSAEGVAPPVPFFGEDILQEFSFSGRNIANNQLRFIRRVRDKSFVDARYIRVVNHGVDGWAGDKISLTVDREVILSGVDMYPRRGRTPGKEGIGKVNPRGGIEKFNPREWEGRSYWELDLQQHRSANRK